MQFKLSTKIVSIIGFVLLVSLTVILGYIAKSEINILLEKTYSEAEGINRRLFDSLVAVMALGISDPEAIYSIIEEIRIKEKDSGSNVLDIRLINSPDITRTFKDPEIARLYSSREVEFPRDEIEKRALSGEPFQSETTVNIKGKDLRVIRYITPVKARESCLSCHKIELGKTMAAVSSVISVESDYSLIKKRIIYLILLFTLGVIFSLAAVWFFLRRMVVKPVLELSQVTRAIAKYGDLSVVIEEKSDDEIGQLAKSFNKMTQDLKISRRKLEQANAELEDRVKQRTEDLEEAKELTERITEGIDEGIMLIDRDFKILWANKKILELNGLREEEVVGNSCYKVTHHLDEPCKSDTCPVIGALKTGKPVSIMHTHFDKEGNKFYAEISVYPLRNEKGELTQFIHITRDVTQKIKMVEELKAAKQNIEEYSQMLEKRVEERTVDLKKSMDESEKQRQAVLNIFEDADRTHKELIKVNKELKSTQFQLIQSEKLKAIGQLASGVAHEVKNPLGILLQNVNYLEKNLSVNKERSEILLMMKRNIKRADDIVRSLVDFSRQSPVNRTPEDIKSVIEESLLLSTQRFKDKEFTINKDMPDNLPRILIDRRKIEQVFINIFINAFQSLGDSGSVFIRTYSKKLAFGDKDMGRRVNDKFRPGEKVIIVEVVDTGVGISKENIARVFDAFFTTKGPREGVGLGLAVTKNIMDMHNGIIEIESKKDIGTKVSIFFKTTGGGRNAETKDNDNR